MDPLSVVAGGVVLGGTVAAGVVGHELSHALGLWLAGVPCRVEWLPGRRGATLRERLRGPPARVTPTRLPDDLAPWRLRVAAMMPLCLVVPVVAAVAWGIDPLAAGPRPLALATVAWVGCALPSPRDFSVLWYPDRAAREA